MSLNLLELDGAYHLTLKLAPFEILLLCFEKLYVFGLPVLILWNSFYSKNCGFSSHSIEKFQ